MFKNKLFTFSLFISIVFHALVLGIVTIPVSRAMAQEKIAEVVYVPEVVKPPEVKEAPLPKLEKNALPRLGLPKEPSALIKKIFSQNPIERKDVLEEDKKIDYAEKPVSKDGAIDIKHVVNLPNVPGEIARSPEYKSYYQIIRDKIKRLAYRNYKKLYEGEVFMTFAVDSSGKLLAIEIKKDKSSSNEYLTTIAENSVQESAPFPPFPPKLKNNAKLTFNVIISFEIK